MISMEQLNLCVSIFPIPENIEDKALFVFICSLVRSF